MQDSFFQSNFKIFLDKSKNTNKCLLNLLKFLDKKFSK